MNLIDYAKYVVARHDACLYCGRALQARDIRCHPHTEGWRVDGCQGLQWLFFQCGYCGRHTGLDALNVERPDPEVAVVELHNLSPLNSTRDLFERLGLRQSGPGRNHFTFAPEKTE
jgi:hypothetical protein